MSFTKVAIIGANGFIGKQLANVLSSDKSIHLQLFGRSEKNETLLNYTQIDLSNKQQVIENFKETEIVYYLASSTIPATCWDNPTLDIESNLLPFVNFVEIAVKLKLKKIVFISSAGTVYGTSDKKLSEESDKKPFSPYGIIKLAIENYLNYFKVKYNLNYDVFRVTNVYGIGQNTSKGLGIINTFLEKIISEKLITIYGNGEAIRNYILVDDVANILKESVYKNTNNSAVYNLASDDSLSINQLVEIIKKVVNDEFKIIYKETRQSDNPAIDIDNSKIKKAYPGFKFTPIESGVKSTYIHLKEKEALRNR